MNENAESEAPTTRERFFSSVMVWAHFSCICLTFFDYCFMNASNKLVRRTRYDVDVMRGSECNSSEGDSGDLRVVGDKKTRSMMGINRELIV
jgi:hypothetical protein